MTHASSPKPSTAPVILTVSLMAISSLAWALSPPKADVLNQNIQSYASQHKVAGFTVAIAQKGQLILNRGYGLANLETRQAAAPETYYAIGSMTKQFTAVAILKLVEAGKIKLDEDIHDLVSEYPARTPAVTVRSLLSHTAGIPDYFPLDEASAKVVYKPISQAEMLARFTSAPLDFQPGDAFAYSNSNFYLLGLAIERASGESFRDFLLNHLFRPNHLDIDVCDAKTADSKMARGYLAVGNEPLAVAPDFDMSWAYSAGNLCATAAAIIQWNQLLHHGKILTDATYTVMTTPVSLNDGTLTTYSAGLFIDKIQGHRHFEHAGDTLTFGSQEAYYPDDDLSIVILSNTEGTDFDHYALERQLGRLMLGLSETPKTPTTVPEALGNSIAGSYSVLGRAMFASNPVRVTFTNGVTSLHMGEASKPLLYIGGRDFSLRGKTMTATFSFPNTAGPEPFVDVYVYEMLMGRGLRVVR